MPRRIRESNLSLFKLFSQIFFIEAIQNAKTSYGNVRHPDNLVGVCRHRSRVWPLEIKFGNQSTVSQSMGLEGDSRNPENSESPAPSTPYRTVGAQHWPGLRPRPGLPCVSTATAAPGRGLGFVTEDKLTVKNSSILTSKALSRQMCLGSFRLGPAFRCASKWS